MSEQPSFLDRLLAGMGHAAEIDDDVEKWHEGDHAGELHDYLGMTAEEYSLWLVNPEMLTVICAARKKRQPLVQAVAENIAQLRSNAGAKRSRLDAWLRRHDAVA
jgi:hypothetical protein